MYNGPHKTAAQEDEPGILGKQIWAKGFKYSWRKIEAAQDGAG